MLVASLGPLVETGPVNIYASGQANVAIVDNAFLPKHINVTTGTTVIWTYASNWSSMHTVTSVGNTTTGGSPLLNSGPLSPGQTYSHTFYRPGLYTYQCSFHFTIPAMSNAWVNVTGAPITPPSPQNAQPNFTLIVIAGGVVAATIVATLALFVRRNRRMTPIAKTSTLDGKRT